MSVNQLVSMDVFQAKPMENGIRLFADGSKMKTKDEFLKVMEELFQFPEACNGSLDAFMDWIRDLSWFPYGEIHLVIEKQKEFLNGDKVLRNTLLSAFQDEILPYWEKRAAIEMKEGTKKSFQLYMVNQIKNR